MESRIPAHIRSILVLSVCVASYSSNLVAGPPLKYAPPADEGQAALFTIFVPEGWTMSLRGARGPSAYGFAFASDGTTFPYVLVDILECDTPDCDSKRAAAEALPSRRLLSGGELDTEYFDSSRDLSWEKTRVSGSIFVSTTLFGQRTATLRFVNDFENVEAFERLVVRCIEHFRIHGLEDQIEPSTSGVPAENFEVDPDLFTASGGGLLWISSPWSWLTALVLGGLIVVARKLQRREDGERIAEANESKRIRKLKEDAAAGISTSQAERQVQDWAKSVGRRRQS